MASLNKVMAIGNVGREPEMRYTPNGNAVATFSVACNTKFGEQETTEWFNVEVWKKLAEICNQHLVKGQQVYIEGRLQTDSWDSEEGKKYRTKVVANTVLFLGQRKSPETPEGGDPEEIDPEDLPFD